MPCQQVTAMSEENWKAVIGYEGVYEVSDQGTVRRIGRAFGARHGNILLPIRPCSTRKHLRVALSARGSTARRYIHRVVAEAHLGPAPSPRHQVNHKDGDPSNNAVANLEWVTPRENVRHAHEHKLSRQDGEHNNFARLTEDGVRRINAMRAKGMLHREIAHELGVSRGAVQGVLYGKNWKHVTTQGDRD